MYEILENLPRTSTAGVCNVRNKSQNYIDITQRRANVTREATSIIQWQWRWWHKERRKEATEEFSLSSVIARYGAADSSESKRKRDNCRHRCRKFRVIGKKNPLTKVRVRALFFA